MAAEFGKQGVPHKLIGIAKAEHGLTGGDAKEIAEAYRTALEFVTEQLEK
jgi:hypothetical protein